MSLILVVDDNNINLDVATSVLKTQDYDVITASSGPEALEKANEKELDLILLDVNMPEMDGFEVCQKLVESEKTAHIPIIFLTAYRKDDVSVVKGLEVGANDYITKPIKNSELLARVKAMLRIKKAEDKIREQYHELEEANRKLIEADQMKSEFVSVVSHDLGSPLTVIKGNLELLRSRLLGPLSKRQEDKLKVIFDTVVRLDKLRADTLDLARMDLGELRLEKEYVRLQDLIAESVADLEIMAEDKEQELTVEPVPKVDLFCDPNALRQVLDNFISNALRYTPEKGNIEVSASIRTLNKGNEEEGEEGKSAVHIQVKDDGRGVPTEEVEKIFERFYRTGQKVKGSTGLGLAIVKGIVEAHGGKVWCESDGKTGSTFNAMIPVNN